MYFVYRLYKTQTKGITFISLSTSFYLTIICCFYRFQLRYLQYKARLDTERSYTKPFLDRLNRIAFFVAIGEDRVARYECQLLVRDYGTHVINSIDAGASLVKVLFTTST